LVMHYPNDLLPNLVPESMRGFTLIPSKMENLKWQQQVEDARQSRSSIYCARSMSNLTKTSFYGGMQADWYQQQELLQQVQYIQRAHDIPSQQIHTNRSGKCRAEDDGGGLPRAMSCSEKSSGENFQVLTSQSRLDVDRRASSIRV